jgi:hypothetical protein
MCFYNVIGKPVMPVARITLQRTLVRGHQCPNNQHGSQHSHRTTNNHQELSTDIDLSQANHRNERLKQKYDHSGRLIYAYGNEINSPLAKTCLLYIL